MPTEGASQPSCHGPAPVAPLPAGRRRARDRDAGAAEPAPDAAPTVALVGSPNVGKSVLFQALSGRYVTVSNYPGTSVEVTGGTMRVGDREATVLDTPGLYSLLPSTDDERVARRILLGGPDVVVHVVDAKNLARSLPLTLQLAELGPPVVVALNMMDELRDLGLSIDRASLASELGVPVVPVVAVEGRGLEDLRDAVAGVLSSASGPHLSLDHDEEIAAAVAAVESRIEGEYSVSRRALASLLLQEDEEVRAMLAEGESDGGLRALTAALDAADGFTVPPAYRLASDRHATARELADRTMDRSDGSRAEASRRLGRWLARPLTGIPVLLLVLYLGLYQFVGVFGAGTVVDWIETVVFEQHVNVFFEQLFLGIPWESVRSLYVGEYGLLTLGLRYAVALVLPIVGAFFLFFSILEDSGYFPRVALLVDRVFKRLGLNGRAVIPIVLGFACDTMATMVTRTLETRREKVLATVLLALAIPCSAQLGVILAVLAGSPAALAIWSTVVLGSFLLVGAVGARLLPGSAGSFHMELPPMRRPRLGNVLTKTVTRMQWYFLEVLPLFLLASVLLWAGDLTGVLRRVLAGLEPVVAALGLPAEAASVFLFGFFRRDYGAAGLFDLHQAGGLDTVSLVVAAVTLTLFVPCIAQFLMMLKERGVRMAVATLGFATVFAFGVGGALNLLLRGVGL